VARQQERGDIELAAHAEADHGRGDERDLE
jgi:hypothetical protein